MGVILVQVAGGIGAVAWKSPLLVKAIAKENAKGKNKTSLKNILVEVGRSLDGAL